MNMIKISFSDKNLNNSPDFKMEIYNEYGSDFDKKWYEWKKGFEDRNISELEELREQIEYILDDIKKTEIEMKKIKRFRLFSTYRNNKFLELYNYVESQKYISKILDAKIKLKVNEYKSNEYYKKEAYSFLKMNGFTYMFGKTETGRDGFKFIEEFWKK